MNGIVARAAGASALFVRAGTMLASLVLVAGCAGTLSSSGSPTHELAAEPSVTTPQPAAPTPQQNASPASTTTASPPDTEPGSRWETVVDPGDLIELQAARLGDGRALVLGWNVQGEEGDGSRVALLWDPATGAWEAAPALEKPRASYATIGLDDGRALVVGGYNEAGKSYSSAYAFDPQTETWSKVGVMGTARTNPAVTQLEDGRVLVAGGYSWLPPEEGGVPAQDATLAAYRTPDGSGASSSPPPPDDVDVPPHGYALATAELFDPMSGTFTPTGPMRYARPGASIATLGDGRVLVVGASTDAVTGTDRRAFETAELYDPETGRFELTGALPELDSDALKQPGKNPIPNEEPTPGAPGELVALPDGGALLVAQNAWWKHVGEVSRTFRFIPATGAWREIGDTYIYVGEPTRDVLTSPGVPSLSGVLVAKTSGHAVLAAGGLGPAERTREGSYYNDTSTRARLFNPDTDTWSSLPALPEAREGGVAVTLQDGSVLLVGGFAWTQARSESTEPAPVRFVPGP